MEYTFVDWNQLVNSDLLYWNTFKKFKCDKSATIITWRNNACIYDIVLEPMAKKYEMWFWLTKKDPLSQYNPVPLQNYAAWFLFAFLLLMYFNNAKAKLRNPLAIAVFLIMFFFLVALHIF